MRPSSACAMGHKQTHGTSGPHPKTQKITMIVIDPERGGRCLVSLPLLQVLTQLHACNAGDKQPRGEKPETRQRQGDTRPKPTRPKKRTQGEPQTPRRGFGFPQRLREREDKRKHGVDENNQTQEEKRDTYKKPNTCRGLKGLKTIQDTNPRDKSAIQSTR